MNIVKAAGYDLVVLETSGIGQSDTEIVDYSDHSLYVMTPEYGAATQLEKIDMLDFADMVAINKADKQGADDALRDVRKQYRRNHLAFTAADDDLPVYLTVASDFNDPGTNRFYKAFVVAGSGLDSEHRPAPRRRRRSSTWSLRIGSATWPRSSRDPATTTPGHDEQSEIAERLYRLEGAAETGADVADALDRRPVRSSTRAVSEALERWDGLVAEYSGEEFVYHVRGARDQGAAPPRDPFPHPGAQGGDCPGTGRGVTVSNGCCRRTSPASSPTPPGSSRSSGPRKTRPGCSPARARRSRPTPVSTICPRGCRRSGCRPPSTR